MPGPRQIHYIWVCRKSWWGIHLSHTPHMIMSHLQAPWVSSFAEPSKCILSWGGVGCIMFSLCRSLLVTCFPLLQCGFCMGHRPVGGVPALVCILREPQSLWECLCPGGDHPWAVAPQGCSYLSVCHPWAVVASGHPHCGLQCLWRCTSSGMEHLWRAHLHLCPQRRPHPCAASVSSLPAAVTLS